MKKLEKIVSQGIRPTDEAWFALAESGSDSFRSYAAENLPESLDDKIYRKVLSFLNDDSELTRILASESLSCFEKHSDNLPNQLMRAIMDEDSQTVRKNLYLLLAEVGDETHLSFLVSSLVELENIESVSHRACNIAIMELCARLFSLNIKKDFQSLNKSGAEAILCYFFEMLFDLIENNGLILEDLFESNDQIFNESRIECILKSIKRLEI